MNQAYIDKWTEMAKKLQAPYQAIAELNMKTIQSLNYLKPDDFTNLKKPEELLEKQLNLAAENGQKALDYMQKSFEIFEKTMNSIVEETKNKTGKA